MQLPKCIRRTGRDAYQFRPYIGNVERGKVAKRSRIVLELNCGTYPSVHEARKAAKTYWTLLARGMAVRDIVDQMICTGIVNPRIKARIVTKIPDGWSIHIRRRGRWIELPGPFQSPEQARDAARSWIRSSLPAVR